MDYINEYIEKNPNMHLEHSEEKAAELYAVIPKDKKVNTMLDIACGAGLITRLLKERLKIKNVYGIDISSRMIEKAKELDSKKEVRWKVADIFQYKSKQRFDLLICADIIEHLEDDHKFLIRLKQLGDSIALKVPLEDAIITRMIRKFKISDPWRESFEKYGHLHHYNEKELDSIIIKNGWRIVNHKYQYLPKRSKKRWEIVRWLCYGFYIFGLRNLVRIGGGFKLYYLEKREG